MTKFKVGDRVVYLSMCGIIPANSKGTVTSVSGYGGSVYVNWDYLPPRMHFPGYLRLIERSLEEQLEDAQKAHGVAMERREKAEEARRDTQSAIDRLKAAIAERDKPKGRVKYGDSLEGIAKVYMAHCNGNVYPKEVGFSNQPNYILMGNLYYDKESAERAQHDRKLQVKLES